MPLTNEQQYFIDDVKPVIRCLPGGLRKLSHRLGIKHNILDDFIKEKSGINNITFTRLVAGLNYCHQYGQSHDEHLVHYYTPKGNLTLFPTKQKQLIDVYEHLSGGGDIQLACEIVAHNACVINNYRILFLDRYSQYFLLIVPNEPFVDSVIKKNKLINFDGIRHACIDLYREIDAHILNITSDPDNCMNYDRAFFQDKRLVFSQLAISSPNSVN